MAKIVNTVITDDLDGSPAAEAVRFSFDGLAYEIDLGRLTVIGCGRCCSPLSRLAAGPEAEGRLGTHPRGARRRQYEPGQWSKGCRSRSGVASAPISSRSTKPRIRLVRDWYWCVAQCPPGHELGSKWAMRLLSVASPIARTRILYANSPRPTPSMKASHSSRVNAGRHTSGNREFRTSTWPSGYLRTSTQLPLA